LFTSRLLRGLEGAAADASGNVTSSSLMAYLNNPLGIVGSATKGTADDTERLEPNFIDRDEMVFATGVALPKYKLLVPLPDGTDVVVQDGMKTPIGRIKVKDGAIEMQLPLGIFKVQSGTYSKLFEIAAGTDFNVELA
jgi:hypothetical protein